MNVYAPLSNPPLLIIEVFIALAVGTGIGTAHYFFLWRNVETLVSGGPVARALLLHLGRFLMTGAGLYFVAHFGALPLSAALLGIVVVRHMMVRRIGACR